jgi:hypothetical protein
MKVGKEGEMRKKVKRKHKLQDYLRKKSRDLSREETRQVRVRIERGQTDVYELAAEFGCVPAQIAGIKARLKF